MLSRRTVLKGVCASTALVLPIAAHSNPLLLQFGLFVLRTAFAAAIGYATVEYLKRQRELEERLQAKGYTPWYLGQNNLASVEAFNNTNRDCAGAVRLSIRGEERSSTEYQTPYRKVSFPQQQKEVINFTLSDLPYSGPKIVFAGVSAYGNVNEDEKRVYVIDPREI